jgi:hypothetical protein
MIQRLRVTIPTAVFFLLAALSVFAQTFSIQVNSTTTTNVVTTVTATAVRVQQAQGLPVAFTVTDANLPSGSTTVGAGSSYTFTNTTGYASGTTVGTVQLSSGGPFTFSVVQTAGGNSAGGATAANQTTGNASLASIDSKTPALSGGAVPVTGSISATNPSVGATGSAVPTSATLGGMNVAGNNTALPGTANGLKVDPSAVTQPISAASLPLPTGAATAAKQPALGTAGTPSADVITVQGSNSATPTPVQQGALAESTAAWTSATTVNTAVTVNTAGYSTIAVTLNQGTTLTGGVVTFEVSDTTAFTNAYQISAILASGSSPAATYSLVASTNATAIFNVAGYAAFRVRLSTVISGTGTVNVGLTASAAGTTPITVLYNGVPVPVRSSGIQSAPADNLANLNFYLSSGNNSNPLYVGDSFYGGAYSGTAQATLSGWTKARTPTMFKSAQATASGNTAVWTPLTGNKFRVLKLVIMVTANASLASGGVETITFQDASTGLGISVDVYIPTTAVTTTAGDAYTQTIDLGYCGIGSAAANNALNVNLSTALATGNVRVIAMGTEE